MIAEAAEIGDEVIDAFSRLHPQIRLNFHEWRDLAEMIEREVRGHFGEEGISCRDLLDK